MPAEASSLADDLAPELLAHLAEVRAYFALHGHPPPTWRVAWKVEKRHGDWTRDQVLAGEAPAPYETVELPGNLLTTAGAQALWNGLVTAGLATPFNGTNGQLGVGDSSTAPTAADTDLNAAQGSSLGGGITGATNASPIVLTTSTAHGVAAGQVVVVASVGGDTNANGAWEVSAATSTTITLLNSSGNAAYTSGGTVKLVNKYRAAFGGAPTVSTNQVQVSATFPAANANFTWNEWMTCTGGAATNKQAAPPPTVLNHAVPGTNLGTKTSAGSWTLTATLSLS